MCLTKDRSQRFQNVADLALALREFAPAHAHASVDRVVSTLGRAGVAPSAAFFRAPSLSIPSAQTAPAGRTFGEERPGSGDRRPVDQDGDAPPPRLGRRVGGSVALGGGTPWRWVDAVGDALRRPPHRRWRPGVLSAISPPSAATSSEPVTAAPVRDRSLPRPRSLRRLSASLPAAAPPVAVPVARHGSSASPHTSPRASPPPAAPKLSAQAAPKVGCDPNYYFDANGTRHFQARMHMTHRSPLSGGLAALVLGTILTLASPAPT